MRCIAVIDLAKQQLAPRQVGIAAENPLKLNVGNGYRHSFNTIRIRATWEVHGVLLVSQMGTSSR